LKFTDASLSAHWPDDPEYLESIEKTWEEPFGDMRQELVFIGQSLDQKRMTEALDECLLTENELLKGVSSGKHFQILAQHGKRQREWKSRPL
tara:strand:- start:496 stop:771 length:276 start_codon:yes stop_codon:yes gene_type:complete